MVGHLVTAPGGRATIVLDEQRHTLGAVDKLSVTHLKDLTDEVKKFTAGSSDDEAQVCLLLITELVRKLFPKGQLARGEGIQPAYSVDDGIVGLTKAARFLNVPTARWGRVTSWDNLLGQVPAGGVVIAMYDKPGNRGHAIVVVDTTDGPHIVSPNTSRDGRIDLAPERWNAREISHRIPALINARTLRLNRDGTIAEPSTEFFRQRISAFDVLTDPTDPRIGASQAAVQPRTWRDFHSNLHPARDGSLRNFLDWLGVRYPNDPFDPEANEEIHRFLEWAAERFPVSVAPAPLRPPIRLSDRLAEKEWWRLFISWQDHYEAAALADPGSLYDEQQSPGFRERMVDAYRRVLDGDAFDIETIDWRSYESLHSLVSPKQNAASRNRSGLDTDITTFGLGVSEPLPAQDTLSEILGGRPLMRVGRENALDENSLTVVVAEEKGELLTEINYVSSDAPSIVNQIFAKFRADISIAINHRERFRAIGRAIRNLHILHPFGDANGRLHIYLLLPKLLMSYGYEPTFAQSGDSTKSLVGTYYGSLFSGGYSLDEIASALSYMQPPAPHRPPAHTDVTAFTAIVDIPRAAELSRKAFDEAPAKRRAKIAELLAKPQILTASGAIQDEITALQLLERLRRTWEPPAIDSANKLTSESTGALDARRKTRTTPGQDASGASRRTSARPHVKRDTQGFAWASPHRSAYDADDNLIPDERQSCVSVAIVVRTPTIGSSQKCLASRTVGRCHPSRTSKRRLGHAMPNREIEGLLQQRREARIVHGTFRSRSRIWKGQTRVEESYNELISSSNTIRHFETAYVPGLLQVPDYARCVLTEMVSLHGIKRDDVNASVQIRPQRMLYDSVKDLDPFHLRAEQW